MFASQSTSLRFLFSIYFPLFTSLRLPVGSGTPPSPSLLQYLSPGAKKKKWQLPNANKKKEPLINISGGFQTDTSEKAKKEAQEKLDALGGEQAFYGKSGEDQPASKNAEEKLEGSRAM